MTYCIVNGQLVPADNATISVEDRGFRYGDGLFETIAVHAGVPYQFDWHMERLSDGLTAIKIPFDVGKLKEFCCELLTNNQLQNGILRIQITRGIGSKGYLPDPTHPKAGASFIIETSPLPAIAKQPIALWQSDYQKISAKSLPVQYKICQGLQSTLARLEATENDCADALLCNEHGHICETSSGNIFWLKDGILHTPSLDCGVLSGSTRAAVLRLTPYPAIECKITVDAMVQAEAVFITNAVWPILAVGVLMPRNHQWNSAKIVEQFHLLLTEDRILYSRKHHKLW